MHFLLAFFSVTAFTVTAFASVGPSQQQTQSIPPAAMATMIAMANAPKTAFFAQKSTPEKMAYVQDVYNKFNKDTLDILNTFYTDDVQFQDPVGKIKGLQGMKEYYANMYKSVSSIKFEFTEGVCDGGNCVFMWTMTYATPKLNDGQPMVATGNSFLKFNEAGKVYFHRDYFDMGEFIYEHIPFLGYMVRKVKTGLSHEEH